MIPPCPVCRHSGRRLELSLPTMDCYECDACDAIWIQEKGNPDALPRYVTTPEPQKARRAS